MGLPKFFVAPGSVRGSFLTLEGENAAHARVLRLRQGDRVLVCDGCGTDYSCTISDISPQQVCLVVDSASASASEPRVQCSVYMAYAKADKLEHVIQKATELGAYEIAAFPSSRCVMRHDAAGAQKKLDRWQTIAATRAPASPSVAANADTDSTSCTPPRPSAPILPARYAWNSIESSRSSSAAAVSSKVFFRI